MTTQDEKPKFFSPTTTGATLGTLTGFAAMMAVLFVRLGHHLGPNADVSLIDQFFGLILLFFLDSNAVIFALIIGCACATAGTLIGLAIERKWQTARVKDADEVIFIEDSAITIQ